MPVSHEYRCLFVHIPKTAGTAIEKALGIFGDWRREDLSIMFGRSEIRLDGRELSSAFLQHLTASELAQLIPEAFNEYLKFTVVRNPWDKMVSVYANKDVNLCQYAGARGMPLENLGFDEFLMRVVELDHAHLRPQVDYLYDDDGNQLVDTVAKWENLDQDFQKISAQLGAALSLPFANVSARSDYRDYYSVAGRKLIGRHYETDIEAFGYRY